VAGRRGRREARGCTTALHAEAEEERGREWGPVWGGVTRSENGMGVGLGGWQGAEAVAGRVPAT
jgi:hypothetical protein